MLNDQQIEELSKKYSSLINDSSQYNLLYLTQISREIINVFSYKLADHELSLAKFKILFKLYISNEPLQPSALAKNSGVSRSTITGLLDGLEKSGFTKRGNHLDRRSVGIVLTSDGEKLMKSILPKFNDMINEIMYDLTPEEHKHLFTSLSKIHQRLENLKK